ncbi:MAG: hypothetical protein NTV88_01315 [Candidatus Micrarchaeota archaeon]|nr:hypothetical protein [Candidatus Micrarchaeota archaeon]
MKKDDRKAVIDKIGPKKASYIFSKLGHLNLELGSGKLSKEEWSKETKKIIAEALKPRLFKRIFMTDNAWAKQVVLIDELHGKISALAPERGSL